MEHVAVMVPSNRDPSNEPKEPSIELDSEDANGFDDGHAGQGEVWIGKVLEL